MTEMDIILLFLILLIFAAFYIAFILIGEGGFKAFQPIKQYYQKPKKPEKKQAGVLIGTASNRDVCLPIDCKHVFVCGTTGSGKTVALSNFIDTAFKKDFPLLIVDGKGDTGSDSLLDIVRQLNKRYENKKKVYIFDLNNPLTSDKYNPFKNANPTIAKDMLINLSDWTEPHYKLNTERYLQKVIDLLFKAGISLSFQNIVTHLHTDNFISLSATLLRNEVITKEQHTENAVIAKSSGDVASSSIARFSNIIESELGVLFDKNGIDIYTALKEKAVILFILNPLIYPEVSPAIGRLITIDSKKAVSKLFNKNIDRTFFIFDEINVYASKVFIDLVNKSRSAGVTSILACQSLADLEFIENSSFKDLVIENCNNYIIMRQNSSKNAEEWANTIGTKESVAITYQVNEGTAGNNGSIRKIREFIFHPDDIKNLTTGEAFIISKDKNFYYKIKVNKPF